MSKLSTRQEREDRVFAVIYCLIFLWFVLSLVGCFVIPTTSEWWNWAVCSSVFTGLIVLAVVVINGAAVIEDWVKTGEWSW